MRRPALIFDFGNVVAYFDYGKAASKLGARLGISGDELLERLQALGYSDLHKAFESGRMSAESFTKEVSGLVGLAIGHDEFAAAWVDIFEANDSLAPLFGHLKSSGYTLVLGSNTNALHTGHFRRQFAETLRHFDRLVLSHEVGHLKPSSEFYLACASAAGADPGDCVFIDDLPENVEGARAAGLVALHYTSAEALREGLEALGVEVPPEAI